MPEFVGTGKIKRQLYQDSTTEKVIEMETTAYCLFKKAILIAATAASVPLLPCLPPERSIDC